MIRFLITLSFIVTFNSTFSQELNNTISINDSTVIQKNSLENFDWLIGRWSGKAFGGFVEANWTSPSGGSMMCAFKFIKNNKVEFYELVTLTQQNDSLVLRLKHFYNDLKGWEEKNETVEFKMIRSVSNRFFFDNWTFERISNNEMNIYVVIDNKGIKEELKFNYHKD